LSNKEFLSFFVLCGWWAPNLLASNESSKEVSLWLNVKVHVISSLRVARNTESLWTKLWGNLVGQFRIVFILCNEFPFLTCLAVSEFKLRHTEVIL